MAKRKKQTRAHDFTPAVRKRIEDRDIGNCNDWWDAICYTMIDFADNIDLDRR